jgi:hypothetical protein
MITRNSVTVPDKLYRLQTKFDSASGRWKARFESEQYDGIVYEFPLPDTPYYDHRTDVMLHRESGIGPAEENLLALTFVQMITATVAELTRRQAQQQLQQAAQSETQRTLAE